MRGVRMCEFCENISEGFYETSKRMAHLRQVRKRNNHRNDGDNKFF